jgi:hypothetical protein
MVAWLRSWGQELRTHWCQQENADPLLPLSLASCVNNLDPKAGRRALRRDGAASRVGPSAGTETAAAIGWLRRRAAVPDTLYHMLW